MKLSSIVARLGAFGLACIAAVLVLFPLPFSDLFVMIPVQMAIAIGVLVVTGSPLRVLTVGRGVLLYAVIGVILSLLVCNIVPIIGKLFAVPFTLVWCYGLAELTLYQARRHTP